MKKEKKSVSVESLLDKSLGSTFEIDKNFLDSLNLLKQYKNFIDKSSIVSKTDKNGYITYVNDKFCEVSGYKREELIGHKHSIIRDKNTPKNFYDNLWATISSKNIFHDVLKNRRKDGSVYYVDSYIFPILNERGVIEEYIGIRHDVTPLIKKDEIIYKQYIDEMTSLQNRVKLLLDIKKDSNSKLALININSFRDINDSYGIEVGDLALKEFSKKLISFSSSELKVYRVYGDIFAFLLSSDLSENELIKTCNKLIEILNRNNFILINNLVKITCSIGISFGENILFNAEVALNYAKKTNDNLVVFSKDISINKSHKENIQITQDIKYALENDGVLVYGQKIFDNYSKNFKYEALMRLKNKNADIISPFKFIEQSKKASLYSRLTQKMIVLVCRYFEKRKEEFSINLMIQDILDKRTIEILEKCLHDTSIASRLTIEIVESENIEKFKEVNDFISRIKALGCKVAIDDFGTGYSNFEYILKLNVDIIKIDGSLIKNIHKDNNSKLVVKTIADFAKVLDIDVVAEYVHCSEVQNVVKSLGIKYSQGFYFHEPEYLV